MDIDAIIFDMDGVIVDTEFFDFQIQKDFIKKENEFIDMNQDFSELIGQSYEMLYETLRKFIGCDDSLESIEEKFTKYSDDRYLSLNYTKLFRRDIMTVLNYAKKNNLKLAVASSSTHSHIIDVLTACDILNYFDVVYSGEFVRESKPHPQIYMNTLEVLGVLSNRCVAVEDSYYGITSAKKAGITTIAYEETRVFVDQSHADYIAKNMLEIYKIVETHS